MQKREHLKLPVFKANLNRKKQGTPHSPPLPSGRNKNIFSQRAIQKADEIFDSFSNLQGKFSGTIDPSLIYEIEINHGVYVDGFDTTLSSMGIHVLSVTEGKKGYWVVFNDNNNLDAFKRKLREYGSEGGHNYDFFNAIESFQNIPTDKKIGQKLKESPLEEEADFVDIELWKMTDPQKNEIFIQELKNTYTDFSQFRITDILSTNSFVLLRVKLTKHIFDEIIELNEIARADRPAMPVFNPFEYMRPDVTDIAFSEPSDNAMGVLIIDSGIISNHPMLEKCVGAEENFQIGEEEVHDTVGHGTAVAGCAAYGDIQDCLDQKEFVPENWIFSAKVMYTEADYNGHIHAAYDPEKLIEHQFKDAIEYFLTQVEYHIKIVNISLGNSSEVWHKHYLRQLPLAALIDELALIFPHVIFIVSSGNQHPENIYDTVGEIIDNYPAYLIENENFKIINPATSALALTIGSIAQTVKINGERYADETIKRPIANENQPSPFSRSGMGINGMIKPELVEYGGNLILSEQHGRTNEDLGGKIPLLHNITTENIIKYDYGTSFSAPKVAYLAGKIANMFPQKSANFIKNMLLVGASYPFIPNTTFYDRNDNGNKAKTKHLSVAGYGLSNFDKAINSFANRTVLWDEGEIGLNQIKVYSLDLPDIFFNEKGKKKITIVLTFNPETRLTRGDSYLGNRMEFHLFHSINPEILVEKYGVIPNNADPIDVPDDLKKFEIDLFPGSNIRKAGCHQKGWKEYKREPEIKPVAPFSLVLVNKNKWIPDSTKMQNYCISVTFEHEQEIELYNAIRTNIQTRTRIR